MKQLKLRNFSSRSSRRAAILFSMVVAVHSDTKANDFGPSANQNTTAHNMAPKITWSDALRQTISSGRPSVILVTSQSLPLSGNWAQDMQMTLQATYGPEVLVSELVAESDPARIESLNITSIPTVLVYANQSDGRLKLVGYRESRVSLNDISPLITESLKSHQISQVKSSLSNFNSNTNTVRVHRVSTTEPVAQTPEKPGDSQAGSSADRDDQITATTHHPLAQMAQSSPQNYNASPPAKQAPPTQPVYQNPPQSQPVYAYVPQQPVYAAPPVSQPVTVQPPAGQVLVQPAPLNVMVAPTPPPQVTYLAQPMAAPAASSPPNAFMAPPVQPTYAAPAQAVAPVAYAAPAPQPAGGMSYGLVMTNPNLIDRFIGGLGQIMAERGNPRVRMSRESPAMMSFPTGSAASPLQTYMAVPNDEGDATEAYIKAYLKLCKEKGITPHFPGLEQPPATPPPSGPVPSSQDTAGRKKWWFH